MSTIRMNRFEARMQDERQDWNLVMSEGDRTERGRAYRRALKAGTDALESSRLTVKMPESRIERAAHAIYGAIADFTVAISEAQTPAECRRIYELIGPLVSTLGSTECSAMRRSEELQK